MNFDFLPERARADAAAARKIAERVYEREMAAMQKMKRPAFSFDPSGPNPFREATRNLTAAMFLERQAPNIARRLREEAKIADALAQQ